MRKLQIFACILALAAGSAAAQGPARDARRDPLLSLVPPDWKLQPPSPNWHGRRYLSPDGEAWLVLFEAPATGEPIAVHMRRTALLEGERVTYLRHGRGWIVASGYRGTRIFYRKAMLACRGRVWHHIAFEYPGAAKREFDRFVTRVSRAVNSYRNICSSASGAGRNPA